MPYISHPIGPLAVLYATARDLRVTDHAQEAMGVDRPTASSLLLLALNQAVAHLPLAILEGSAQATLFARWEHLRPEQVSLPALEGTLTLLSRPAQEGPPESAGQTLQRSLTRVWQRRCREPATYGFDLTITPPSAWVPLRRQEGDEEEVPVEGGDSPGSESSPEVGFVLVTSRRRRLPFFCTSLPVPPTDPGTVPATVAALHAAGFEHLTLALDPRRVSEQGLRSISRAGYHAVGRVADDHRGARKLLTKWSKEELEQRRFEVLGRNGIIHYARAWTAPLMGPGRMRVALVQDPIERMLLRNARGMRDDAVRELRCHPTRQRARELRERLRQLAQAPPLGRGVALDPRLDSAQRVRDGRSLLFSTDLSLDGPRMFALDSRREEALTPFRHRERGLVLAPPEVREGERLEAYATIVYVASLLWAWAERRLRERSPSMTLDRAMGLLDGVNWVRMGEGKRVSEWTTGRNRRHQRLLDTLGATPFLPETYHPTARKRHR